MSLGTDFRLRRLFSGLVACVLFLIFGSVWSVSAAAFEGDVHFGLTQWLAREAGYDEEQAQTIAIGDQRVDSGDMFYLQLAFAYACGGRDDEGSIATETYRFPSAVRPPAPPEKRVVVAGSDAAKETLAGIFKTPESKAGFMLLNFGEALHRLQDSWSNQGVPDVPTPFDGAIDCDATRVWAAPRARGGWDSHRADITRLWPADVVAMSEATYAALMEFPTLKGHPRVAKSWDEIKHELPGFIAASTKSEKKDWFVSHGIADVSFLEGVSLPDGKERFTLKWPYRHLPAIGSGHSGQHDVDADLLDFFDRFFAAWATTGEFDRLVHAFALSKAEATHEHNPVVAVDPHELALRLGLWRVRDHAAVADLVHSGKRFTRMQLQAAERAVKRQDARAEYASSLDAFFPLLPKTRGASPLAPFVVIALPASPSGHARALAAAKFHHAPYDTVAVLAEQREGGWRILAVDAIVEH
ncbi:MAG: hypothetical protein ABSF50_19355 [Burkholderiaceae bacterium]